MTTAPAHDSALRIVETDPRTDPRWESFVMAHCGSIYHHPAWLMALSKEYGQKGVYLACENSLSEFQAVMPLFPTRGMPFGRGGHLASPRLSSLPRTPLGGPLSLHPDATAAILLAAVSRVAKDPRIRLQIKTQGPELGGLVPGVEPTPWRSSYVLSKPHDTREAFRIPDRDERAKIRWAVNKATRLGVRIRPADTETDLREWYTLYLATMRRNAVPPRNFRFFKTLWSLLKGGGMMELLLAEWEESGVKRVIAGSIFFKCGDTVSYAFNASSQKDLSLRANDVVLWQAISKAFREGFDFFDFGEVPSGHTKLAQFKSKWGAEPVALYHYYYPALPEASANLPAAAHQTQSFTNRVWKRLPLGLTAWLGDRIYSYL